jgi:hypothetical protein
VYTTDHGAGGAQVGLDGAEERIPEAADRIADPQAQRLQQLTGGWEGGKEASGCHKIFACCSALNTDNSGVRGAVDTTR